MTLTLSWKHKFWILIGAMLVGLILLTLSALRGLDQVTSSYAARGDATSYESASYALLVDWLKIESQSGNLRPSRVEGFQQQMSQLDQSAGQLAQQARGLGDQAVVTMADDIREQVADYVALREEWLAQSRELGLSNSEGLRGRLTYIIDDGLRRIGISILNEDINQAIAGQQDFLVNYNLEAAERVFEAVGKMQDLVRNMGWEDNDIGQSVQQFDDEFNRAYDLVQDIVALEARIATAGESLETTIEQQNASLQSGLIARTTASADNARQSSSWLILVTAIIVIAVLVLTLTQASRTLVRRLNEVVGLLTRVAGGDLTNRLQTGTNTRDEFNALGNASNQMMDDISGVIRQVIDGNRDLNTLQSELKELMIQMGRNSEQVEAQTEQTAAAVQEISHTAAEIVNLTNTVNEAAQVANDSAHNGSRVIKSSVDSMHELSMKIQQTHEQVTRLAQTGEKVNSIVDVINGLAEQTNLLALNAAIEAARAGEAGRGFSVVADEVRSLAEKTVNATSGIADIVASLNQETREIGALMQQGLEKAAEGETSAAEAATVIDRITDSIDSLAGDMKQVVSSVEGISATTEEIAQKVEQIHSNTLETRTIRSELEDHTRRLSDQADSLTRTSSRFRV